MDLVEKYLDEGTIKKTSMALAKLGFKLGTAKTDLKKKITSYIVMTPSGKAKWMTTKEILALIE